ncbi:MAG: PKD domain-containing protein [Thermoplasmatales archaeon]|nr:MAG: PKD domain-containing protein [Thermoplasmatales archaeon]
MKIAKTRLLLLVNILIFSIFTCVFPIEKSIALGNTIYVDDSGGADYTNIQDAIEAASSGDTVYVYSGTYNENVEINKDLTLTGENKDTTIIDGGKNGHTLYAYGAPGGKIVTHISGFTIRNAGGLGYDCIALSYENNSIINNNKIINSDESDGIQLDHCNDVTISDNTISNNEGSGVSLTLSDNNIIHNNVIQSNQKGMYIYYSSNSNEIYENTITGNSQYGVHIVQSLNNRFYLNDFTNNGQNAQDPLTNYWSYNSQGNYWEDYNDYDSDEDGIGDSPYDIPGGSNQDEYPLGYFLEPEPPGGGNQQPTAHLPVISPNPATYGENVTFNGSGSDSDGYIAGYNWRSSIDGQLNTQSTFSTSSLTAGIHVIYFKVKDNDGDWSSEKTATQTINLIENQAPTAHIDSISPNPAVAGEIVTFIGHGTDDGEITEWKWISSLDGVISSDKSFDSSVLSKGMHTIYFQVRDNDNEWSKQDTETLTINDESSNHLPVANAGGPYSCYTNMEINIDGSDSYDDDGSIVDYLWDFGDDITGSGKSPTHTYTAPGNYSITLTVTNEYGDTSTDSTYVIIVQSSNQSGSSEGLLGFELEVPFPLIVVFELIFIIAIIALFIFWIKRK